MVAKTEIYEFSPEIVSAGILFVLFDLFHVSWLICTIMCERGEGAHQTGIDPGPLAR